MKTKKIIEFRLLLKSIGCGCRHFQFEKLRDFGLDQKLKDSLSINNYRKYLLNQRIKTRLDNTLCMSSIEMLIKKEERDFKEIQVIDEVCKYLDDKYEQNHDVSYINIKKMIENNKHKSINEKVQELIKQNSLEKDKIDNMNKIKKISKSRTKELHISSKEKSQLVYSWPLLNRIQINYAKNLFKERNT